MGQDLPVELYAINYIDKHASVLVYKRLLENAEPLHIVALGLERYKVRRYSSSFKIIMATTTEVAKNLPGILKGIKESLSEHALYPYLSFDFHIVPLSKVSWNFDSYDDKNFQKIFIRKRKF